MDRLTGLGVFVAAVEEGSFAAAARRFGLSAAMAGKHVSAIEAELNARLLQRTTRRLSLTDAGQTYYERCKRILEAFDEANREASDSQGTARGVLRVAAPVTFGAMHLGEVVARSGRPSERQRGGAARGPLRRPHRCGRRCRNPDRPATGPGAGDAAACAVPDGRVRLSCLPGTPWNATQARGPAAGTATGFQRGRVGRRLDLARQRNARTSSTGLAGWRPTTRRCCLPPRLPVPASCMARPSCSVRISGAANWWRCCRTIARLIWRSSRFIRARGAYR